MRMIRVKRPAILLIPLRCYFNHMTRQRDSARVRVAMQCGAHSFAMQFVCRDAGVRFTPVNQTFRVRFGEFVTWEFLFLVHVSKK